MKELIKLILSIATMISIMALTFWGFRTASIWFEENNKTSSLTEQIGAVTVILLILGISYAGFFLLKRFAIYLLED